jgi:hypothetical protein
MTQNIKDCRTAFAALPDKCREGGQRGTARTKKGGEPGGSPPLRSVGSYRLKEKVATRLSSVISVVTRVPGTGPMTGEMKGPETLSENAR